MSKRVQPIPGEVQEFLTKIVEFYVRGSRNEAFAKWVATRATLMLEYYGLLY